MRIERSKEWWMTRIKQEPDVPIGADGAFYARQPLGERLMRSLGFGRCSSPQFEDIVDDDPNWSAASLQVLTIVHLGWLDRLRLLISGRLQVDASVKTDVTIKRSMARSNVSVLSPFDRI